MLVLTRKLGEKILIDSNVVVTIVRIDRGVVRIGIEAPPEVAILRSELLDAADAGPECNSRADMVETFTRRQRRAGALHTST